MTRADRRRLLQQLAFSESHHFSWDNFPTNIMAYDRCLLCLACVGVGPLMHWLVGKEVGGVSGARFTRLGSLGLVDSAAIGVEPLTRQLTL